MGNDWLTVVSQADKDMRSGHEGRWFESSHHRPTYQLGSTLLAAAPLLYNNVNCSLINERSKKIR